MLVRHESYFFSFIAGCIQFSKYGYTKPLLMTYGLMQFLEMLFLQQKVNFYHYYGLMTSVHDTATLTLIVFVVQISQMERIKS